MAYVPGRRLTRFGAALAVSLFGAGALVASQGGSRPVLSRSSLVTSHNAQAISLFARANFSNLSLSFFFSFVLIS